MEKLKHKLLYAAFGAFTGLVGLISLSKCSGGACKSCLRCAGAGIGISLMILFNKLRHLCN